MSDIIRKGGRIMLYFIIPRSYYTQNYRSFASALVAYDWKQAEVTGDIGRTSYAIKLLDATGNVLKAERYDLTSCVRRVSV